MIVNQLLSCIFRGRVLFHIFRKCFEALFWNTINRSLVSFKILWLNCSNSVCILLLLNVQGIWWSNPYESAVYSSVVSWYDEKLWTVFLMYVVVDFFSCCFRHFDSFFWWRFAITLNLLFKAMFSWWNTAFKITKFKLLFSLSLFISFNSFFNFHFSECLLCISQHPKSLSTFLQHKIILLLLFSY